MKENGYTKYTHEKYIKNKKYYQEYNANKRKELEKLADFLKANNMYDIAINS